MLRKKLFKETVSGLYDVKQQAFSSIAALREKMSGSTIPPPIAPTDIHYVQDQNIHLASLVCVQETPLHCFMNTMCF